jgi:glutamine cyclotransferase
MPKPLHYQVVRQIHRSEPGFTEGLVYRNGSLFESTGGYGSSGLNQIDPQTGQVRSLGRLSQDLFGEGLEFDGQIFYQLSWKEHQLIEWDSNGRWKRSVSFPYEGWGLTKSPGGIQGEKWISSDGSHVLHFFDRATHSSDDSAWTSSSNLSVMNGPKPEGKLNELEYARGAVFANVFQDNRIVQIDPATGCVSGELDLSGLMREAGIDLQASPESVLNGIAYRPETDTFFITGKNWPTIYEVQIFS